MKISESWLKEWVSTSIGATELADKLTLAGLEVEGIESAGPSFNKSNVVIGQILTAEPHPDANRLQVCQVDVGKKSSLTIVCGASNARAGEKVPTALAGAKLPNMEIKRSEIRGVTSNGMLCSGAELGLEDQSGGLMILDQDAPVGKSVQDYLDLEDQIIEVDLTPNRGDCLGILGVAREVSALTGDKLNTPVIPKVRPKIKTALSIELKAPDHCPRYVGRAIRNIDMSARTPDWMAERLRRSGVRSINAIVDVTNYVMLELGQPMHAFDLSRLSGGIVVRMAKQGEKLKLLDGSEVKMTDQNLVIADKKQAVALAGIMGGDNSAISDSTVDIYLEAAFFAPSAIIGKARQFGMHTDASHRFERGVDSEGQINAMERATQLILSICGGEPGPVGHGVERKSLPKRKSIRFDQTEIRRIMGIQIPANSTTALLKRLGMKVKRIDKGWQVVPPSWRFDISGQHDLVEEAGRCYGFDKVEPRMPVNRAAQGKHKEAVIDDSAIKQRLTERGYYEVITYSFVDPGNQQQLLDKKRPIRLANPIADNMAVMRQSMWTGLLEAVKNNLNRQENRVRLFEMGHVFERGGKGKMHKEIKKLAGVVTGPLMSKQWSVDDREVDFFDLKGDIESLLALSSSASGFSIEPATHPALHPGQSGAIRLNRKVVGYVGKLHPSQQKMLDIDQSVYLFEIDLSAISEGKIPNFSNISRFPAVQRDIAVLVDSNVEAAKLLNLVSSTAGELLKKLELFDIYQGERIEKNKKSFAFSLTFQSESSNLTSSEVDAITEKIIDVLGSELDATLRA